MKNKKGFTLVELLAVIVILGVLLLVAVPIINNVTSDAKFNAAKDSAMNVLEASRTCSMATGSLCSTTVSGSNVVLGSLASYIDSNGTIGGLTLAGTADNPMVSSFTYTENGYTINFTGSDTCTITNAKSKINSAAKPTGSDTAVAVACS